MHNRRVQTLKNCVQKLSRKFPENSFQKGPQNPENPNTPLLGNDQKWEKHRTPIGAIISPSVYVTRLKRD